MNETMHQLFTVSDDINAAQMSLRALVISVVCLLLIRLAGRRSFGIGTALDNMIAVLLGGILSRAVVGASPFVATVIAATTVAVLHRCAGLLGFHSHLFGKLVKGSAMILYKDGRFNRRNMRRNSITMRDIKEGVRLTANGSSFSQISAIYMERSGKISVIKKREYHESN